MTLRDYLNYTQDKKVTIATHTNKLTTSPSEAINIFSVVLDNRIHSFNSIDYKHSYIELSTDYEPSINELSEANRDLEIELKCLNDTIGYYRSKKTELDSKLDRFTNKLEAIERIINE